MAMTDRWCPECETTRRVGDTYISGPDCYDCGTGLQDLPKRVQFRRLAGNAVLALIVLGWFALPAIWLFQSWGEPIITVSTETVTYTTPQLGGFLPGLFPWLAVTLLVWILTWAARGGIPPRGM